MIKKILIILFIILIAIFLAVVVFSRKAPELLKKSIENALGKKVFIKDIEYHFPSTFVLRGFEIREEKPFEGELSFYVDEIRLVVSPISFSKKALVIDDMEVQDARIVIWKTRGKLTHSLSNAVQKEASVSGSVKGQISHSPTHLPLEIHQFKLENSHFNFIDYDAQEGGFVVALDQITAQIKNISLPPHELTRYTLKARLLQGRDEKPAEFSFSGWTRFDTMDTDALLAIAGVHLPYFVPYYGRVTPAMIREGYLDTRAAIKIEHQELTGNIDFDIAGLLFEAYELGNQLFGLNAEEILSFIKDASGHLKFQIMIQWNIADRSVRLKDVIRRGIEKSLKRTVLGNVGNIVQRVIMKVGEGSAGTAKDGVEEVVKKIKDLLKY